MSVMLSDAGLTRRPRVGALRRESRIVLDISRLLSRVLHSTPTGVDRVEMAYAQTLLALAPERIRFAAFHPSGLHGRLSTPAVRQFLDLTVARWTHEGQDEGDRKRWVRAARSCLALTPKADFSSRPGRCAYLHLSGRRLERGDLLAAALRRERAVLIPFVHDLIPLEFPEYARPDGAALHRRRLETVTRLAAGVLVNSDATGRALAPHLDERGRYVPVRTAPLAPPPLPFPTGKTSLNPYFVVLSTIEPRKNHLLLLNLWRRFVETLGPQATPKLVLIGRRGWENENIIDLLDRCISLRDVVVEKNRLPDRQMVEVLAGARAVLAPSFAEGYGMPIVEALALGVPVIASDLAAHREAGGEAAEFLDPLDSPAWAQAVLDYARPASARRAEQLGRMKSWTAPSWEDHVRVALDLIDEVCV